MRQILGKASFHKAFLKLGRVNGPTHREARFDSFFGPPRTLGGGLERVTPSPAGPPNTLQGTRLLRMAQTYSDFCRLILRT